MRLNLFVARSLMANDVCNMYVYLHVYMHVYSCMQQYSEIEAAHTTRHEALGSQTRFEVARMLEFYPRRLHSLNRELGRISKLIWIPLSVVSPESSNKNDVRRSSLLLVPSWMAREPPVMNTFLATSVSQCSTWS